MKFLSNFDTQLEHQVVSKYISLYGKENVFCIHRATIFRVFNCVIPGIALGILIIFAIALWSRDMGESTLNGVKNLLISLAIAYLIYVMGYRMLKKYFDYKMDFTIVTPEEIASYNQSGFLTRTSRTIDADKIKTVSVNTSGILKSLFNFGDLIFLSEGDQAGGGDINLNYVHNVNVTKNKVRDLIEPHLRSRTMQAHSQTHRSDSVSQEPQKDTNHPHSHHYQHPHDQEKGQ